MTLFQSEASRVGKKAFHALVDHKIAISAKNRRAEKRKVNPVSEPPLRRRSVKDSYAGSAKRFLKKATVTGTGDVFSQQKTNVKVLKVGIWDVNSLAGNIARVAASLNRAQARFCFFEVSGAVPAGLISDKERILAWLSEHKQKLTRRDRLEVKENTIAEDFYPQARKLRLQLGLDYIVGLTRSMIAFDEGDRLKWNYFASAEIEQRREFLVSTYDLRKYSDRAGRPLEAAIGGVVISVLLAAMNSIEHHESRGCLFDLNEDRDSMVDSIRSARIELPCLKLIRPDLREASEAMVHALRKLRPK